MNRSYLSADAMNCTRGFKPCRRLRSSAVGGGERAIRVPSPSRERQKSDTG
jgi:hypothetical protein